MKTTTYLTSAGLGFVILLTASAPELAKGDPILYGTENGNTLVAIDLGAGTAKRIGSFGRSGCWSMAFSADGTLYTFDTSAGRLATVDLATGKATLTATKAFGGFVMGMAFGPDDTLYLMDTTGDALHRMDVTTGTTTRVGFFRTSGLMDFAFHPDGTLYAISTLSTPTALWRVELDTGRGTRVTPLRGRIGSPMGLTFAPDGALYAVDYSVPSRVFSVDPSTGQATEVFNSKINNIHSAEIRSVFRPRLKAQFQAGDRLVFSWPDWAKDYVLQTSQRLGDSAVWADAEVQMDNAEKQHVASLPRNSNAASQFFRLIQSNP
jgi:sugar lactone lactonase YvrE